MSCLTKSLKRCGTKYLLMSKTTYGITKWIINLTISQQRPTILLWYKKNGLTLLENMLENLISPYDSANSAAKTTSTRCLHIIAPIISNMYKIVANIDINGAMYTWSIELLVKSFLAYQQIESLSAIHQTLSYEKPHNHGWYTMWSHTITCAVTFLLLKYPINS